MPMRLRKTLIALSALVTALVLAAPAMATDGEGLAGETNDKVVTFFCLGVLLFFVLVIVVGSAIQGRLEKRKDAAKAAQARARIGW
jgi:nitrogen fixation/metabolism regulation signal transduction histidine kinase